MYKFFKVPAWTLCNSNCRVSILAWAFTTLELLQIWVLISFALCRLVWDHQSTSKPQCVAHSLDSERSQVTSLIGLVLEVACTSNETFHTCGWRIRTRTVETTEWILHLCHSLPAFFRFRAVLVPYAEQNCYTVYSSLLHLRLTLLHKAFWHFMNHKWSTWFSRSSRSKEPGAVARLPLPAHLPCPETSRVLHRWICLSKVRLARCCNKWKPGSPELIGQRWLRSFISSIYHNLPSRNKSNLVCLVMDIDRIEI